MKLTKGETNDLLYAVGKDNFKMGIILKLIYIYGKEGKAVLTMKWNQIDFNANTISFKDHPFPLTRDLRDELLEFKSEGEYLFLEGTTEESFENDIDILRKRIRYYLDNTVKRLDVDHKIRHSGLSITDLKRLRGQHLLFDGVDISIVMDLYCQKKGTSTQFKKYLEYDALMDELHPCKNVNNVLSDYTDLNIGDFDSPSKNLNFFVSDSDGETFTVNIHDDALTFSENASDDVKSNVTDLFNKGFLKSLEILRYNEVKYAGELSFIRI